MLTAKLQFNGYDRFTCIMAIFFIFSKSDLVMLERFFGKEVDLIYNFSDVLRVPHRLVGRGHEES